MGFDFINDSPTGVVLFIMIFIFVIISIAAFVLLKYFYPKSGIGESTNSVSTFLGLFSVLIGVILALILVSQWETYNQSSTFTREEAVNISLLYDILSYLPNTEDIKKELLEYSKYLVNIEYPSLAKGEIPISGAAILSSLNEKIYNYEIQDDSKNILYQKIIDLYDRILALRFFRLDRNTSLISSIIWIVIMIGVISMIGSTLFMRADYLLHIFLIAVVATVIASVLFLMVSFDLPYRGQFRIRPNELQLYLENLKKTQAENLLIQIV